MYLRVIMFFCCLAVAHGLAAPYAGTPDPTLLDPRYPDMQEWAKAGWHKDPDHATTPQQVRLQPGDDLAAAVAKPNRTVLLAPGTYPVSATLRFADHVLLRGAGPGRTKLVVRLRGQRPTGPDQQGLSTWTTGLLLHSVANSGIENLTVAYDDTLPLPRHPSAGKSSQADDPMGKDDLHVVLARFTLSRNCWMSDCELLNSGDHPLIVETSAHITVENSAIAGAHHKSGISGSINITGSEYCLFNGLQVWDINHFVLHEGSSAHPCHYNVIVNSRIQVDVRFRDADSGHNLLQDCVIAVPAWHDFPPISQGSAKEREHPPGSGNLIYLCTITRDFASGGRSFSVADNPNRVYRVRDHFSLSTTVEEAGPSPKATTLWPVR